MKKREFKQEKQIRSKAGNAKARSGKHAGKEKFDAAYYTEKIRAALTRCGKKPIGAKELAAKCRSQRGASDAYAAALGALVASGEVVERKHTYVGAAESGCFKAEVTRLSRTFGFCKRLEDETEFFVPGKFLLGAMTGDQVLMRPIPSRTGEPEGEVVSIMVESPAQLTGMIVEEDKHCYLLPDTMSKSRISIAHSGNCAFAPGDKVLAQISHRGTRHAEHRARILFSYGCAQQAASCAEAVIAVSGIPTEFPEEVITQAEKLALAGVQPADLVHRMDLREECIFTIDSAESKDLDDAVSIQRRGEGYRLGVHIADVSHYVRGNTPLDMEALHRGTSVYYADKVIPMLPKCLSNGICSLNPGEDRLAFSAIMDLDKEGQLRAYSFHKSVIRSRVKGVYKEINTILAGTQTPEIAEKYAEVTESLLLMNELADKRLADRDRRGAPSLDAPESKLILNEDGVCVDVQPRTRGRSELLIEEFMLLANESAARVAREKSIPFVYRIHENPSPEKLERLEEVLNRMNIPHPVLDEVRPCHFAQILKNAKDSPLLPALNNLLLRSMAKAKYAPTPVGHFGLALADYTHFTSPIRRYPDLAIHRILSDVVLGYSKDWFDKRYAAFVQHASERSSAAELRAMTAERDCEDCYKAEYMLAHIGEEFDAVIASVTDFGFYVELPSTVQGLVHVGSLPEGEYTCDGAIHLTEQRSNTVYTVGQAVRVRCDKADVNSGNIDFSLVTD